MHTYLCFCSENDSWNDFCLFLSAEENAPFSAEVTAEDCFAAENVSSFSLLATDFSNASSISFYWETCSWSEKTVWVT